MPESRHFICTSPATSLRRMAPCSRVNGAHMGKLGVVKVQASGGLEVLVCAVLVRQGDAKGTLLLTRALTFSTTSRKTCSNRYNFTTIEHIQTVTFSQQLKPLCFEATLTSFFLYLSPSLLQLTAPVTAGATDVVCCLTPLTPRSLAMSSCS